LLPNFEIIWTNPFIHISEGFFMQVGANLSESKLHDLAHWGIRAAIGVTFIVHSIKKFDPSWQGWLIDMGLPPELQIPIALAEFVGGIFLLVGVLTRITASIFAIITLGAIFMIRGIEEFFVSKGGWEWDLMILAGELSIIVAGPGIISIAHIVKKIPRYLQ
jgi:putative oxidoreductase